MHVFQTRHQTQSTTVAQTHLTGPEGLSATGRRDLSQLVQIQANNESPFSLAVKFDLHDGYCRTRGLPAVVSERRSKHEDGTMSALGHLIALLSNRRQVLQMINQESIIWRKRRFSNLVQRQWGRKERGLHREILEPSETLTLGSSCIYYFPSYCIPHTPAVARIVAKRSRQSSKMIVHLGFSCQQR